LVSSSDRDAEFAAFMAADGNALLHTAWLLCGDGHRAEELTQQALVSTYVAWGRVREGDPLAYARRTLANARIDSWRRRRREMLTDPQTMPIGSTPGHDGRVAERDELVRALRSLTARQRRIVVLRHFVGLSEAEVADDLGVSLGTVKSTASRALAQLRGQLAGIDVDRSAPEGNRR
jgi:RNA polymerase sigma-70 factor (sigma-E family)